MIADLEKGVRPWLKPWNASHAIGRLGRGEHVDHFETVRVTKDGRRLDVSLTISPLRGKTGRVVGASKVARNITERRQAEITRAHLASIVESSDNVIVEVVVDVNVEVRRLF